MGGRPELTAVVVAYNSADHISGMLEKLQHSLREFSAEVIVVDNASTDASFELASAAIKNGRAIRLEKNVGYGQGANEGVKLARSSYVIVLNDDISVASNSLALLRDALDADSEAVVAAPTLVDAEGRRQVSGRRYLPGLRDEWARLGDLWRSRRTRLELPRKGAPVPIGFVLAACLMVKRESFMKIGGFSTEFFMLGEDIDLCRRVKELGGYCLFVPEAQAQHDQSLAQERRVKGAEFSKRMLDARDVYYRIWLKRPERMLVNLFRAFGVSDQPFRLLYHLPKVFYDGPSLRSRRLPGLLLDDQLNDAD